MPTYIISPRITPIDQPSEFSCWATALAMLYNWNTVILTKTPEQIAKDGGKEFEGYFNTGLPHSANPALDKFSLLVSTYSLMALPLQTYTLNQWKDYLEKRGPLAILADDAQGLPYYTHILVIEGIEWTAGFNDAIFHVVDPDGGIALPMSATELQTRLDAPDAVSLTLMRGWCYP